jgi:hypothetical protein
MMQNQWIDRAHKAGAKMAKRLREMKLNEAGEAAALARFRCNMIQVFVKHDAPDAEKLAEAAMQHAKQLLITHH